jgi:hypothetical protein
MRVLAFLALASIGTGAEADVAPLYNPAVLNIGFVCRWQDRCMSDQQKAMVRALKYVGKYQPAASKIRLCNRQASRVQYWGDWKRGRVDWIGFDNCIRNARLAARRR